MTSAISIRPTVASPNPYQGLHEHMLIWAVIASFALHTLAALLIPKLHFEKTAPPKVIQVELAPPQKPEPLPQPEPIKPQVIPEPKHTPVPRRIIAPAPIPEPLPRVEPAPEPSPSPPVITAPLKPVEPPPTFTAPPPEPVRPTVDIDAARSAYGSLLGREIAKHKQYPKIAQMRGWQGEVTVDIQLDSSGNVQSSTIQKHSGYEALDKQALEMVKKASPFPAPPEALRGSSFNIQVPVTFRLE